MWDSTRGLLFFLVAFSVIYDWRLNGKASSLASKLPRIGQPYQAPDDKSARKAVVEWVVRGVLALLLVGIAVKLGLGSLLR